MLVEQLGAQQAAKLGVDGQSRPRLLPVVARDLDLRDDRGGPALETREVELVLQLDYRIRYMFFLFFHLGEQYSKVKFLVLAKLVYRQQD